VAARAAAPRLRKNARVPFFRRRRRRERPIGEAEAYHHSYGERSADVKTVVLPPRRKRYHLKVSGEDLRRRFQERLDARKEEEG
jgi:hypothetical protein